MVMGPIADSSDDFATPTEGFGAIAKVVIMPADLLAALNRNKRAQGVFDKFSQSHRKEYVEWITGAKRDETCQKPIVQTIA
jgi:uncharacterized protein YdeI (YjbR/CyaY-like superfamily)